MGAITKQQDEKLYDIFNELGAIIGCNDQCESSCVFYEVGAGPGCPLNQFRDRIEDVLERRNG